MEPAAPGIRHFVSGLHIKARIVRYGIARTQREGISVVFIVVVILVTTDAGTLIVHVHRKEGRRRHRRSHPRAVVRRVEHVFGRTGVIVRAIEVRACTNRQSGTDHERALCVQEPFHAVVFGMVVVNVFESLRFDARRPTILVFGLQEGSSRRRKDRRMFLLRFAAVDVAVVADEFPGVHVKVHQTAAQFLRDEVILHQRHGRTIYRRVIRFLHLFRGIHRRRRECQRHRFSAQSALYHRLHDCFFLISGSRACRPTSIPSSY